MDIELISQTKHLEALREEWDGAFRKAECRLPFLSHTWFLNWCLRLSHGKTLQILLSRNRSGTVLGIAPLAREGSRLQFLADREVTDYCDFIYPVECNEQYFNSLFQFIRREMPEISGMDLINVPAASPTLSLLPEISHRFGWRLAPKESEPAPYISIPSSYSQYLTGLNRKRRHELRRKVKKLKSLPDVHIKRISLPEKIDTYIDDFIRLHRTSTPEKSRFWENQGMSEFFHSIARGFSETGWFELLLLYTGKTLLAGLISFLFGKTVFLYNLTFDREYAGYSPGIYLVNERIRSAIAEGCDKVDFLRGNEKYKYDFGAQDSKIFDLHIEFGEKSG